MSTSAKWPFPRLIAHRGGGSLAPENTLSAIRVGHQQGFKAVEFDVVLAADGVPVLLHDETVDRTTNGSGPVNALDSRALAGLDAGSWFGPAFEGEPVPRFEDAARLCVALGLWANVEIKPTRGNERQTGIRAATIAREAWRGISPPPLLSSFQPESLAAAREVAPELPRGLLFDAVPPDWLEQLRALDCMALHCNARKLDEKLAQAIKDAGYGLAVWTVNDTDQARRSFAMGVNAIFTDRLDLFHPGEAWDA
ncbi:MAG TPA: glycerophosphodiester phosphodiesterase [Burkholderiales bacterium]|nr:glycerophosphodiester phosphodiesterase [Burkholderiales bacterium]